MTYFDQVDDSWQIKEDIRNMVQYRYFNLLDDMASLGTFDLIFCRNVLIYFDEETKVNVLSRIAQRLPKDGVLLLGGAETVLGLTQELLPIDNHMGLYKLADGHYNLENISQAVA